MMLKDMKNIVASCKMQKSVAGRNISGEEFLSVVSSIVLPKLFRRVGVCDASSEK